MNDEQDDNDLLVLIGVSIAVLGSLLFVAVMLQAVFWVLGLLAFALFYLAPLITVVAIIGGDHMVFYS